MDPKKVKTIWIDLDNSPHVPFFRPIINELRRQGCEVLITSRDCFETKKLLDLYGIQHTNIGKHYGKNIFKKIFGTLYRSIQLYAFLRKKNFDLAISHGSRAQIFTAAFLVKIPLIHFFDYEHSNQFLPSRINKFIVPEYIKDSDLNNNKLDLNKVYKFCGIKEDVYINDFIPTDKKADLLFLKESSVIVLIRPPASMAHYHNPKSDELYFALLKRLANEKNVQIILVPRTEQHKRQALEIFKSRKENLIIPEQAVDGLNLLWKSDLVISGGGTMVREAVGLGIPAYSIFCGKTGDVDKYLANQHKLIIINSVKELNQIKLIKRKKSFNSIQKHNILPALTDEVLKVINQ